MRLFLLCFFLFSGFFKGFSLNIFNVDSQESFNEAQKNVENGDVIQWKDGEYTDIYMSISKSNICYQR